MKTKFLFLVLLLLYGHHAFSAIPKFSDTANGPKVAHWTQQQFFDTYGTNDTARALIQYYFKRNKKAKRDMLIWGTAGIAAAIGFDRLESGASSSDATTEVLVAILLLTVAYLGVITILFSIYYWIHFSRQRLLLKLQRYKAGQPLSPWLLRNRAFRKALAIEREASRWEKS